MTVRPSGRKPHEPRLVTIEPGISPYAEGSALVSFGNTRVHCTATIDEKVPPFLRNSGKGWVTAEYGMLPRATHSRSDREAARGKQTGRTQEIQRLIGRSLRSIVKLDKMGERQIIVDCDVLQADGGTRTAAITGGYVALRLALQKLVDAGVLPALPLRDQVAAISCGIFHDTPVADLDYPEDSSAKADVNFVLTARGGIVEVQGTAEEAPFSDEEFAALMKLAREGIQAMFAAQNKALGG